MAEPSEIELESELESIVINSIKEIHIRKKRADKDNIIVNTPDLEPEIVKDTLETLCKKNIVYVVNTRGVDSYRFVKKVEEPVNIIIDERVQENISEEAQASSYGNNVENESLLNKEIKSFEQFNSIKCFISQINDLKEFINYKLNNIRENNSNLLLERMQDEINFLKEEVKDYKKLISEILDCQQRQNQSTETNRNINLTDRPNQWKHVTKGPSRFPVVRNNDNNKVIKYSNRFNVLENEIPKETDNYNNYTNDHESFVSLNNTRQRGNDTQNTNTVINRPNRPNPVINQHPERETYFKDVTNKNRKTIRVLSDSIPKGIRVRELNNCVHNGFVKFKCFPGATINNLDYYAKPTLEEDRPDIVVIHVGINNLLHPLLSNSSDEDIAVEIINLGKMCKNHSVENVMISSLLPCSRINPNRIRNVNKLLSEKCQIHNFTFINNSRIQHTHLWKDGLHLEESGKVLLAQNFIDNLNNFLYLSVRNPPLT